MNSLEWLASSYAELFRIFDTRKIETVAPDLDYIISKSTTIAEFIEQNKAGFIEEYYKYFREGSQEIIALNNQFKRLCTNPQVLFYRCI